MGGKNLDFKIVALVVVVSFLIVILGQFVYQKYYIDNPLSQELRSLPGVTGLKIEEDNGENKVIVSLGKVKDLEEAYLAIKKVVERKEGPNGQIEIVDKSNTFLNDVYREMNFSIQEGIANGTFADMYDELRFIAAEKQLQEWSISLDQKNIYLQIQEKDHYLYKVIPRVGSENHVEGN